MSAVYARTAGWLDFYPAGKGKDPIRTYLSGNSGPQLHADGIRFSKALGGPTGQMQARYRGPAGQKLIDIAAGRGCWWKMTLVRDGREYEVSAGKVDSVSVAVTGPAGELHVVVEGRDIGVPFEDTAVWFNDFMEWNNNLGGRDMIRILKGRPGGKPDEVVKHVIQGMLGVDGLFGGHWRLPADFARSRRRLVTQESATGRTPGDDFEGWLSYGGIQEGLRGAVLAPSMLDAGGGQSLWAFLDSWRNPPLNELFVDYIDGQPQVILREKPFVNATDGKKSPWFDLETHTVALSEVDHIGLRNGLNRINFAMVYAQMAPFLPNELYAAYTPAYNRRSIRDHGLRRLEESTPFFNDQLGTESVFNATEWRNLIIAWNALNHRMYSGQISLRSLRPEIRVGQRIVLKNSGQGSLSAWPAEMTFYVESVSHALDEGESPSSSTMLTVSRGYDDDLVANDVQAEMSDWSEDNGTSLTQMPPGQQAKRDDVEFA